MQSSLPLTGKCHYCNKPTPFRFCSGTSCQSMYWYRKHNPEVKRKKACTQKRSKLTLQERIDAIVARNMQVHYE